MNLKLKKNNKKYWEFIRQLRSDKRIQSGFIEEVTITKKEQEAYMNKYKDNYNIFLKTN